jgi:hypothetical protein
MLSVPIQASTGRPFRRTENRLGSIGLCTQGKTLDQARTESHQPGPATSAALIVGDHNMSRPVARRRLQRSMTSSASGRAARSALGLAALARSRSHASDVISFSASAPSPMTIELPGGSLARLLRPGGAAQDVSSFEVAERARAHPRLRNLLWHHSGPPSGVREGAGRPTGEAYPG